MHKNVEEQIRSLTADVANDCGYELFDVSLSGVGKRTFLRVFIDKEGGITLDDCEIFSRRLEALLDVEDLIAGPYTLEVSSPGLDRPLKSLADFQRNIGKMIRVVTKESIGNQSFFVGRLEGVDGETIRLSLSDGKGKKEVLVPLSGVSKARLEITLK